MEQGLFRWSTEGIAPENIRGTVIPKLEPLRAEDILFPHEPNDDVAIDLSGHTPMGIIEESGFASDIIAFRTFSTASFKASIRNEIVTAKSIFYVSPTTFIGGQELTYGELRAFMEKQGKDFGTISALLNTTERGITKDWQGFKESDRVVYMPEKGVFRLRGGDKVIQKSGQK